MLMVISFISMFTDWMFTVDENSIYHRGPINFVQMLIPLLYVLVYFVISIHHLIDKHFYASRKMYFNILIYCFAPIVGGSLQFAFPKVPFLIAGIIFATLMMYTHIIQNQVSIDYLTKINNRSMFDKYLADKIKNHEKNLYLLMMDLDYFKDINDTFGHVVGDEALISVGKVLHEISKEKDQVVARFGGDEFVMVLEIEDEEIDDYIKLINDKISHIENKKENEIIKLSIGYAKLTKDIDTVPSFISQADAKLYQAKQNR